MQLSDEIQNIEIKAKKIDLLHWCLIGVVLALLIWIFWLISKPKQTVDDGIRKEQIDNLEKQTKIAKDSVVVLNKSVEKLNSNYDSLKSKLEKNESKIKINNTYVAIKDSFINSNNVSELQQFLTDKGKESN